MGHLTHPPTSKIFLDFLLFTCPLSSLWVNSPCAAFIIAWLKGSAIAFGPEQMFSNVESLACCKPGFPSKIFYIAFTYETYKNTFARLTLNSCVFLSFLTCAGIRVFQMSPCAHGCQRSCCICCR